MDVSSIELGSERVVCAGWPAANGSLTWLAELGLSTGRHHLVPKRVESRAGFSDLGERSTAFSPVYQGDILDHFSS